ncbi:hypothetical protein GBAR_LOCUS4009 [Geodia barretti]|uniref:Uncharacterized protein n=1 Tax=Geodia barretti TaxID=519541 RepID=A0AA35W7S7_GEOBA|nr:hypothetical protein GBAR_LOCUS4009 [Geodia barretti]
MQSHLAAWDELVEQVRKGERAEEAVGSGEFWQKLVVRGVGDTPLSFLPPDLGDLLESVTPSPHEELVVLPPHVCLDSVLQPEFVVPPAELLEQCRKEQVEGEPVTERGKRKREESVEEPNFPLSPNTVNDVIDLTQEQ